jgi:uncharacterized membrane protein
MADRETGYLCEMMQAGMLATATTPSAGLTFLLLSAFLASSVEMVEALTIVLAVGTTRGWRSTLIGVGTAVVALAAVVAALGPALTLIPISVLRLVVGALLLVFGLQWLHKAILRASGYRSLHDEDEIFARERAQAEHAPRSGRGSLDWYAFVLSFKGVFLEGLEVAFIVITFGSAQGSIPIAAVGAAAAIVIVGTVGILIRAPLSRVPENTLKFAVGVLLCTFGTFWGGEGAGVSWPGSDVAILAVLGFYVGLSLGCVRALRVRRVRAGLPVPVPRRRVSELAR